MNTQPTLMESITGSTNAPGAHVPDLLEAETTVTPPTTPTAMHSRLDGGSDAESQSMDTGTEILEHRMSAASFNELQVVTLQDSHQYGAEILDNAAESVLAGNKANESTAAPGEMLPWHSFPQPQHQDHRRALTEATSKGYDYSAITDESARHQVHEKALIIMEASRMGLACMMIVGRELIDVKKLLGHGQWLDWLRDEFRMSERTAQNYMATAEKFRDSKYESLAFLPKQAIYLLASTRVPARVVDEVLAHTDAGERLNVEQVREVVEAYRSKPAGSNCDDLEGASLRNHNETHDRADASDEPVLPIANERSRQTDASITFQMVSDTVRSENHSAERSGDLVSGERSADDVVEAAPIYVQHESVSKSIARIASFAQEIAQIKSADLIKAVRQLNPEEQSRVLKSLQAVIKVLQDDLMEDDDLLSAC